MTATSFWTPIRFLLDFHIELGPIPDNDPTEPHNNALDTALERRDDDPQTFGFTRNNQ
jgi:hypothetical protein